MKIIKRNGTEVDFDIQKIEDAVLASMVKGSGVYKPDIAKQVAYKTAETLALFGKTPTVADVEKLVHYHLCTIGEEATARAYEGYRAIQEFKRESRATDESILGLIRGTNKEAMMENSNKNARSASTQRDLMAGEVSKDIARRLILPAHIVQAHDSGMIHVHDLDYYIQPIFNCCLVNLQDMLDNGTVINGTMITSPPNFQKAATIATQIMAQVASGQWGGQTISLAHLAPYVRRSYEGYVEMLLGQGLDQEQAEKLAIVLRDKEIEDGIKTIQYQINTLATSNGQSPFVSIFMWINELEDYREETILLTKEMMRQRLKGTRNEKGVFVTPAFPKLLYVLDDNNTKGTEHYDVTKLAAECVSKRMMPDFISAKHMRENYQDNVFGPMGCRSFLAPWKDENGKFKFYGRFNAGVVSVSLLDIALAANGDVGLFWSILDKRAQLVKETHLLRREYLRGTTTHISPIHWEHGAIARLPKGSTIDHLLDGGRTSFSFGYVGLYDAVHALTGKSHTEERVLALQIMTRMKRYCDEWKAETGMGFGLYGTPAESLTYRFAKLARANHGLIEGVTDKDYLTNSYHVNVTEEINAFDKLVFEAQYQKISSGGAISYVEVPNLTNNIEAIEQLIDFMYHNIQYAEINTKSDYCQKCSYDGEILIDDNMNWYCPECNNTDTTTMNVCRRTCGYLGANFWNHGRTQEIKERVLHL